MALELCLAGKKFVAGVGNSSKCLGAPILMNRPQVLIVFKGKKCLLIFFTALKRSPTSRAEQQLNFLNERMNEYKQAALKAKKNRDIELAKKYLRIAKVVILFFI